MFYTLTYLVMFEELSYMFYLCFKSLNNFKVSVNLNLPLCLLPLNDVIGIAHIADVMMV